MALQVTPAGRFVNRPARRGGQPSLLLAGIVLFFAGATIAFSYLAPMFEGPPIAPEGSGAVVSWPSPTPSPTPDSAVVIGPSPTAATSPTPPPAVAPSPTAPEQPVDGYSFALIAPSIGYSAMVHEGIDTANLYRGPGHYPGTPWPGQAGNVGVAAHNTYWLAFARLKVGDRIEVRTQHGLYAYQVTDIRVVHPDDRTALAPTADHRLTLTTCYPLWAGAAATQRLIFSAREIGGVG